MSTYVDDEGREWGFIAYIYGHRQIWVCLDDLSNQEIPAFSAAPVPNLHTASGSSGTEQTDRNPSNTTGTSDATGTTSTATGTSDTSSTSTDATGTQNRLTLPILAISLVALAVVLSLVLIRVFWRKKPDDN